MANKVRIAVTLGVFVLLTACVGVPPHFMQSRYEDTKSTTPYKFSAQRAPKEAAVCVLKNIDANRVAFSGALSPEQPKPDVYEVRAKSTHGFAAIAEIVPAERGSNITVWVSNHYMGKGSIAKDIGDGC